MRSYRVQNDNRIWQLLEIRKEDDVGHILRALANTKDGAGIVRHFLTKRGSKANVKVVGKAVNRGGGHEMEVPSIYICVGQKTNIDMLSKLLNIPNNLSVRVESAECGQKRTRIIVSKSISGSTCNTDNSSGSWNKLQSVFQRIFRTIKQPQKLNLLLSLETYTSHQNVQLS